MVLNQISLFSLFLCYIQENSIFVEGFCTIEHFLVLKGQNNLKVDAANFILLFVELVLLIAKFKNVVVFRIKFPISLVLI